MELSDVAVVPETNDYRSPIKMFEYMAHGKAIVAPALPPIHVALEDRRSGLLFTPGGHGMVDAIVAALEQPGLRHELGSAAKRRVFADFTWEAHATRILSAAGIGAPPPSQSPSRRRNGARLEPRDAAV
jgi:glycosyltransferase involved in cell wall biosynthesis